MTGQPSEDETVRAAGTQDPVEFRTMPRGCHKVRHAGAQYVARVGPADTEAHALALAFNQKADQGDCDGDGG